MRRSATRGRKSEQQPPTRQEQTGSEHQEKERERESHFTSTDFGRNASISAPPSVPSDAEDAEEDEEDEEDDDPPAALGRLYM